MRTAVFGVVVGVVLGAIGCLAADGGPTCADGVVCPPGQVCAPAGGACVEAAQVAACAGRADGDGCDLPGIGAGLCRAGVCVVAGCGDGVLDAGEACDDGNAIDDDACTSACALPTCGDGVVQGAEACDAGAANGDDRACTTRCLAATCGDNLVWAGVEACDAGGANADDDACTTSCARAVCGDGLAWAGVEVCDDGNLASGDGCRADCAKLEACGDADLDAGEACDDGNGNAADGCDACVTTSWRATTVVGASGGGATDVGLDEPEAVALDQSGNLYIADTRGHRIRRVDVASGAVTTIAGSGQYGMAGDGGPATSARLTYPGAVAVDGLGNVIIADTDNDRIRRVDVATGTISTIAGTGAATYGGDGGPATSAPLRTPLGLAVDGLGNVYVADTYNDRIRRIDADDGVITTIAGTGLGSFGGDGGPASLAWLARPTGLALDGAGNLYVADAANARIRRIDAGSGQITTVAGTGAQVTSGDGGPATSAGLAFPSGVTIDRAGNLYITERSGHAVRRVDAVTGTITTVAGTGAAGFAGDGGAAIAAMLDTPRSATVDDAGDLYIADAGNNRIRRVDVEVGTIATVAGSGAAGAVGDGGPATSAGLASCVGVAVRGDGALYIADGEHQRVRRVDLTTRHISTIAGTGAPGDTGDGGAATSARMTFPTGVAVDAADNVYVAVPNDNRVRRIAAADGIITTVAGTGAFGATGDTGPATEATLGGPSGVAVDATGNLYIADSYNHRVRRVDHASGVITTVAGTGTAGSAGDDGPATAAQLVAPAGLVLDGDGNLFIADQEDHRVRRVAAATGTITTVAGTGAEGGAGDGGLATSAQLAYPRGVALDGAGHLYIADTINHRVRKVDASTGVITTVVGTGLGGDLGDHGPAALAELASPTGVALDAAGNLYVADRGNDRIRRVDAVSGVVTTLAGRVDLEGMGAAATGRLGLPQALARAEAVTLIAGGPTGTVQALWPDEVLEVIAGRYPHSVATGSLARLRAASFGDVGGVAYDATDGRIYLTESSANRLHVVTPVDPGEPLTWTIATFAGDPTGTVGAAGHADVGPGALLDARFRNPTGLAFDPDPDGAGPLAAPRILYVADTGNHVIRAIDLSGGPEAATITTIAGTPSTLGYFGDGAAAAAALLYQPTAVVRCPGGDLFVADTGNHRVRRIERGSDVITTVLGDGVAASSGEGTPASTFPVDGPRGLACDAAGNLLVTSTTAVRLLPAAIPLAATTGVVDGTGPVQTIYGAAPRTALPASITHCLTGITLVDDVTALVADACAGLLVELARQPTP